MSDSKTVAVIGSGIAGLSAAWFLSKNFKVTLFEKSHRLGMGQQGVDVETSKGTLRIDVLIRVFSTRYYPNLYKLCQHLNIDLRFLDNDSSFSDSNQNTYFRYHNFILGELSLSYIRPKIKQFPWLMKFLPDYGRLLFDLGSKDSNKFSSMTLAEYFKNEATAKALATVFSFPYLAAIATCKNESS